MSESSNVTNCDYRAATSHALLHRRIHRGEKPCDNCDYFADKRHLLKSHKQAKLKCYDFDYRLKMFKRIY